MNLNKILNNESFKKLLNENGVKNYFIIDTDQYPNKDSKEHGIGDVCYERYCYNRHKNNKITPYSVFLYRQPKSRSRTRKFYIFGGGIFKEIDEDADGNKTAYIYCPFEVVVTVDEDDVNFKKIKWTSKKYKGTWSHFWNQYGINQITEAEFYSIILDKDIKLL